jgi:hypothetical protein
MTRGRTGSLISAALFLGACHVEPEQHPVAAAPEVSVQRIHASWHGEGTFIGVGVLVTDAAGATIPCDQGAFSATVEWSQQSDTGPWTAIPGGSVTSACNDQAAGNLALVVDNSGSEEGHLSDLQAAAGDLVEQVLDAGGSASLVRVSTNARVLQGLTSDGAALYSAIDGMEVNNGWTSLWDGIRQGNETLGAMDQAGAGDLDSFCADNGRVGIVAFTDGKENNSADEQDYDHTEWPGDGIATELADLYAMHSGGATTPIYTLGMGDGVDGPALQASADTTGGRYQQLDDSSDLGGAFGLVGDYLSANQQVCGQVPEGACGPLFVHVTWTYTGNDGSVYNGESVEHVALDCPVVSTGKTEVVLLTLGNPGIDEATASGIATNAVAYTSPVANPTVLVVLDENHHGEFADDANYVADLLSTSGYATTRLDEQDGGISIDDLTGYDVVWYSNPGYPMDDAASRDALQAFLATGGGVVLQGDDMGWSFGDGFSMSPLTDLQFVSNGTDFCGEHTDNDEGAYFRVTLGDDDSPAIDGLHGASFLYGDDIDDTVPMAVGEQVHATATLDGRDDCDTVPVIVTIDP